MMHLVSPRLGLADLLGAILVGALCLMVQQASAADLSWEQVRQMARPKPCRAETLLADGAKPAALIVVPDDPAYGGAAAALRAAIEGRGGPALPIEKGASLVAGPALAFGERVTRAGAPNLILLGDLTSNPAVARLYVDYHAFEDAAYPGRGGHTVRTLVDPLGLGWNAVVLGGSGPQEVEAAVREYVGTLQARAGSITSPYALTVTYGEGPGVAAMRARSDSVLQQLPGWASYLLPPEGPEYREKRPGRQPQNYVLDLLNVHLVSGGLHYATTGEPEFARAAGRAIDAVYEHLAWVEAHRKGNYDEHYMVEIWLRAWQQVANCPHLTAQQRERGAAVMAFLATQMSMYRRGPAVYGKTSYRILSRHEYAGVFAGDALCRYVQRHCELAPELAAVLADHRENFGMVISAMLGSYATGFDHKWGLDGGWHLLQAAAEEPREGYIASETARLNADFAVMCINNAGQWANFGADNVAPAEHYDAWQILGRAELLFRDGTYQWWLDHRMRRPPYKTFIMSVSWLGHWYQTGRAPQEPRHVVGLNRALVSRPLYEDLVAGRGRLYAGIPVVNDVPLAETFNKISFRDGLGEDDQYLLLDGLGGTTYSGNDANAITEYSRFRERLLVEIEAKPEPFYRNGVSVSRGNADDPVGTFARLQEMVDSGPLLYTRSQVSPLSGCDHTRHLFMQKGGYCVVLDDLVLRQEDEHFLTCNFRSPGTPTLDPVGRAWRVQGEKAELHLQNVALPDVAPAPGLSTAVRSSGATPADWRLGVQVLRETAARTFRRGDAYRFANLFYGSRRGEPPAYQATAFSRDAIRVRGRGDTVYGAPTEKEARLGELQIAAAAFRLAPDSAQFVRLTRLTIGAKVLLERGTPVTLHLDFARGACRIQACELRNTRTVLWVPAWQLSPSLRELAQGVRLPDGTLLRMPPDDLRRVITSLVAGPAVPKAKPPVAPAPPSTVVSARVLLPGGSRLMDATLFDLDGDGREELIGAREDGHVVAVGGDGRVLLDVAVGKHPVWALWAGRLAGRPAILCGDENGLVRCLDAAGRTLWEHRNTHWGYGGVPVVYSVAAGDFTGEGKQQVALGCHGGISLLDGEGKFVRFTEVYAHAVRPMSAVGPLGGKKEWLLLNTWGGGLKLVDPASGVVVNGWAGFWGGFAAYQEPEVLPAGDLLFIQAGSIGVGCGKLLPGAFAKGQPQCWAGESWYRRSDGETAGALVRDLDGDGTPEILTGVETGFLVCYDLLGKRLWKRLVGTRIRALAAVDVTGDGVPEVVVAGDDPALTCFDRKWNVLWRWSPEQARPVERVWATGRQILAATPDGAVYTVEPHR